MPELHKGLLEGGVDGFLCGRIFWNTRCLAVLLRVFMTSHAGGIDSASSHGNVLIELGARLIMFAASMLQHVSIRISQGLATLLFFIQSSLRHS